jgi:magnesium transporter
MKEKIADRIRTCLEKGMAEELKKILDMVHPVDLADTLVLYFDQDQKLAIFNSLSLQKAALLLREIDSSEEVELLESLDEEWFSQILEEMPSDDRADVLAALSQAKRERLLSLMEMEESREARKLLEYKEDTAGGIMTTDFIALREDITVEEAIEELRAAQEMEMPSWVYVVDADQRLVGFVPLRKLIAVQPQRRIGEVMTRDLVSVPTDLDQEEVARIVSRDDLLVVPVVDSGERLVGVITVDDVIDVIEEEATEDIYEMGGVSGEELLSDPVFRVARRRLTWVLTCLIGGLICAAILTFFKFTLSQVITLAAFIPVIMDMGGNIGVQSSTIVVRGIALGHIDFSRTLRVLFKEIRVGGVMGLACGAVVGTIAQLWQGSPMLGVVVGVSMFLAITIAAATGILMPIIFRRLNIDPAIAAGPFVTSANDITGLLVYLGLATALMKSLIG